MSEVAEQYDLGALAHKLETLLLRFDELPAVEAERRRLDAMVQSHDTVVAEWSNEIARLSAAIERLDPHDPKHIHQPAPHPHRELDSIPILETGLKQLRSQMQVMEQRPVPEHPHHDLANAEAMIDYVGNFDRRLLTLQDRLKVVDETTASAVVGMKEHIKRVADRVSDHTHTDINGGLMRLANEMAEQQVTLQDQITVLQEQHADLASLVAGLGHQMAAMAERVHEEMEAIRLVVGGYEKQFQAIHGSLHRQDSRDTNLEARIEHLEADKADREHNHDVNRDIAEPGRRHIHEMVVKERIGSRTVLRCDLPNCNAEWAEVR